MCLYAYARIDCVHVWLNVCMHVCLHARICASVKMYVWCMYLCMYIHRLIKMHFFVDTKRFKPCKPNFMYSCCLFWNTHKPKSVKGIESQTSLACKQVNRPFRQTRVSFDTEQQGPLNLPSTLQQNLAKSSSTVIWHRHAMTVYRMSLCIHALVHWKDILDYLIQNWLFPSGSSNLL